MSKFSRWLDAVQDEEAGLMDEDEDEDEFAFLPAWAKSAVSSFDASMDKTEDFLAAQQEKWTPPWLTTKNVQDSAQATLEASKRFRMFVCMLLVSAFFFAFAFFVALPVLVLRPQKFALCFTMGSLIFMGSFGALRGVKAQLQTLCQLNRLPFTLAYVSTMIATLWAACIKRSFLLTVIASALQITTLLYYLGSYVPGGARGVRLFLKAIYKTAAIILKPVCFACSKCCSTLVR